MTDKITKWDLIRENEALKSKVSKLEQLVHNKKNTEKNIIKNHERFSAIFDRSLDCIYEIDFSGNLIDANQAFLDLFGFEKSDINSVNFGSLFDKKQLAEADKDLKEVIEKGYQTHLHEYSIRSKSGDYIEIESKASLCYHNGKPHSIIGVARDITSRKKDGMNLRQSAVKFLNYFKISPCLAAISDFRTGRLVDINDEYAKITGYTPNEVIGKTTIKLGIWADPDARKQLISMIDRGEKCNNIEARLRTKSGEVITVLLSGERFVIEDKEYFFTLAIDITKQKEAERILRESNEKYRQLFEMESDALFLIDNETGNILEVNQAAENLYGYSRDQFLTMKHTDISAEPLETRKVTLEGRKIIPIRWHRKSDETVFPVEISARHFDRQGHTVHIAAIRDITERISAEEALKSSEEKYKFLAEKMTDIVWIMDLTLHTTYVSPSIEKALGFSPEERIAQDVSEQLTPSSLSDAFDTLAKELALEQSNLADPSRFITLEAEYYHKNGSTIWFENIISGIRDANGFLTGLHGVSRNISKRKEIENALRESEKRYRELVDFLPTPLYEMDMEGNVLSGNRAIFEMFGYTPDDLEKGLNIKQIFLPEDIARIQSDVQFLLKGEKTRAPEYTGVRKDGSTLPLVAFSSPIISEGKTIGVAIDITQRKKAEDDLKKTNKSLADAQRIAHVGNWELEVANMEMRCSDEVYRILGKSATRHNRMFEDCLESFHSEDRGLIVESIEKASKERVKSDIEGRVIRPDGSIRDVRVQMEPVCDDSGETIKIIGIIRDLTARKKAEKELQYARDMMFHAEKLAAIGRLSTGIAHEILNPVNIISLELQILHTMKNLSSTVKNELKICLQQIKRIVNITDKLKQFARVTGKEMFPADINKIISSVLNLYATQMKIEGIEKEVSYQKALPKITLDKTLIEEVIFNLITNAMDAMEGKESKVLRIATNHEKESNSLKISIADTGTGIKEENLSKIFEPFFTTKSVGKGTGLGLSLSYNIINDLKGRIWVENNIWGGATFNIVLPLSINNAS